MRYDAEHKQQTRQRVLKEAAKAIRSEGPHRIGVAAVMAKAGLTHGGFYAHFASKDDFVAQTIGQMFDESGRQIQQSFEHRPPAEGLAAYLDFYLSPAHRDTRTAGCPLPFLSADAPRLTPASRERYAQGVADLEHRLAEPLRQLGHAHADALAGSVLAEMVGALGLARAEPDLTRSDRILARSRDSLKHRLGLEAFL
jgi:TetR/AcrR family transcriptional repressor of nem operon